MSKHTPERLTYSAKLSGSENHLGYRIFNAEGWAIAEVQPLDEDGVQGEVYARQFVAAPDLLEALLYYRNNCTGAEPSLSVFHRMLDGAIAKATGEQS